MTRATSVSADVLEVADGAQSEGTREALSEPPESHSAKAKTVAMNIGAIALAVILTGAAAKMSA